MSATREDYKAHGHMQFRAGMSLLGATDGKKPGTWQHTAIRDGWTQAHDEAQGSRALDKRAPKVRSGMPYKIIPVPAGHPQEHAFDGMDQAAAHHLKQLARAFAANTDHEKLRERLLNSFARVICRHKKAAPGMRLLNAINC